ncbi:putative hydroxypyruvate isomerase [Teleopsis dalmanni]|uniref:putative hydroxypyruvate isomerase n=1 Tax=Teleopsis dalmanni TaxID=139649 RepID=UPI0018CD2D88|nr:putative hydroxypyruvate isomerase [Teleopsis dalmanni]
MVLKFAANLNFLFTEGAPSLADKIKLAHRAGFKAVEIPFPNSDLNKVVDIKNETGIEVALVNIALGSGELNFGSASIPGAEETFKKHLSETVEFAKAVNCKKIHIMAGLMNKATREDHLCTYKNNLKYAASYLEKQNLIGVIEPINKYALPSYFMNCYETATSVLNEINSKHLRLMLDIFHLQHIRGNVTHSFKDFEDLIGHIQIAQVPNRNEPDVSGELDYGYVFSLITGINYEGWIGCEYKPATTTVDGLKWLSKYNLKL